MTEDEFLESVIREARIMGLAIEENRNGQQIDFGNKKLHEGHLRTLFQAGILNDDARINSLIDLIAPGRPCTHVPMKRIVQAIKATDKGE